jgi:hypothetical protein
MAAARRAYWKGYLKLSLVACPVALYPASSQAERTHFHQINHRTGNRLRQQMIDERTGDVVEGKESRLSAEGSAAEGSVGALPWASLCDGGAVSVTSPPAATPRRLPRART